MRGDVLQRDALVHPTPGLLLHPKSDNGSAWAGPTASEHIDSGLGSHRHARRSDREPSLRRNEQAAGLRRPLTEVESVTRWRAARQRQTVSGTEVKQETGCCAGVASTGSRARLASDRAGSRGPPARPVHRQPRRVRLAGCAGYILELKLRRAGRHGRLGLNDHVPARHVVVENESVSVARIGKTQRLAGHAPGARPHRPGHSSPPPP